MKRLRCGDRVHELVVRETRDGLEVVVDGARHALCLEAVGPGNYALTRGGRVETFQCVADDDAVHLLFRGVTYRLAIEKEGGRALSRHSGGGLEAPMPGKVIEVAVKPGQRVAKGELVLVIEAMKMENALRAPREGVVKSVAVRVGEAVSPGAVLLEIE